MKSFMKNRRSVAGFTLTELLIVVAIIGVLSAVAVPAYTNNIQRSHRADMKAALLEAGQWMERNYSLTQSYMLQGNGAAINNAALAAQVFGHVPRDVPVAEARYLITFSVAPTANAYTLQAIPQGPQASDKCGTLRVNHRMDRTVTGGESKAVCWGK
jgi:type IV pilus assembly protein PilE